MCASSCFIKKTETYIKKTETIFKKDGNYFSRKIVIIFIKKDGVSGRLFSGIPGD